MAVPLPPDLRALFQQRQLLVFGEVAGRKKDAVQLAARQALLQLAEAGVDLGVVAARADDERIRQAAGTAWTPTPHNDTNLPRLLQLHVRPRPP